MDDHTFDGNAISASDPRHGVSAEGSGDRARPRPLSRLWTFRILAVCLGLSPVVIAECALRMAGVSGRVGTADPFVRFRSIEPLFVFDPASDRYVIPVSRQEYFYPDSFPAHKGNRTTRVFCLGGSTVQGNPYTTETAFTTWLRLSLTAADPERTWEVVNCGGISYASYRLVPILDEVLQYEPDLIVVCTGQNEFLEQRAYAQVEAIPPVLIHLHRLLSHLRLYLMARRWWYGDAEYSRNERRTELPTEVDALLDYRGGLEAYHRDDAWTAGVMRHFELNLRRMAELCRAHGVPMILLQPPTNLKDCPPFKSEFSAALSAEQRETLEGLWNAAKTEEDPDRAADRVEELLRADPRYAAAHFFLGKRFEALGDATRAKAAFLRAKDEDICPLRLREPMYASIERVARDFGLPLIDVRPLLEPYCALGILGHEIMMDHVHPNIEGHQTIALRLFEEMRRMGFVTPRPGWIADRKARFQKHLESLDDVYFARGKMRLEGLRMWSEGRSFKVRPSEGRRAIDHLP